MEQIPAFNYGRDSWLILSASLELIEQGHSEFYRVAALQLRLLLCDTTRRHNRRVDISLAKHLWPDLHLNPLNPQGQFDLGLAPIPLEKWLAQLLPGVAGQSITLRDLIRRVCDQDGGAHVDYRPQAGLQDITDVPGWICKIGAEVARVIGKALNG